MSTNTTAQALQALVDYGVDERLVRRALVEPDLDSAVRVLRQDPGFADAHQDYTTSWAVDLPQRHHRQRWARHESLLALVRSTLER